MVKYDYDMSDKEWGDHIEWSNPNDLSEARSFWKVWGHKRITPKVGETVYQEFENGWALFRFIEVKPERNPPDMFFGKVEFVEQGNKNEQC